MGMIADVIFNDVNGKTGPDQPVVASMYFHDDDPASLSYSVMQIPPTAAGAKVTFTESETAAGSYMVKLESTLAADFAATDADTGLTIATQYDNTMIEITAIDDGELWTTQEFMVRRNRRPGILEAAPADTNGWHPGATMAAEAAAAVGTTNKESDDEAYGFEVLLR
jgi:N-acetylmuramoyl-L-alanine amidase CwlA